MDVMERMALYISCNWRGEFPPKGEARYILYDLRSRTF